MDYPHDFGFQQQQQQQQHHHHHQQQQQQHDFDLHPQQPCFHHDLDPSAASLPEHAQNMYAMSQPGQKMTCDVKPRLTKEQHDVLEAHYQKQQKPNTSTKRGFAEALNVSLEKVNNWFQNRRAKSKQDAKKQQNPVGMFNVQQPSQLGGLEASDSDTSPAFASADFLQMMHEEDQMLAYEQSQQFVPEQQLLASNAYLAADISVQELNRRTMTQEQFDALGHQDVILNSGDLAMLSTNPEAFDNFIGYNQTSMQQEMPSDLTFDLGGLQQHVVPVSNSDWTESRSSPVSLSQSFEQHRISTPTTLSPSQWQPGQSVPVDFDQLNQEFQKAAQARQMPMEQSLAWPEEDFGQDSSTSHITQSMGNVGLHTPQLQQPSKSPTPVSSLAARRQRQRPAPLGLASLRSQSYSGTIQTAGGSPGQMQPPSGTPPQLRRIKSSNVVSGIAHGRVQKHMAPPRSPLNWSFTDGRASPQVTRHQASQSTSALAPPTPLSPPDVPAQQQWQPKHVSRHTSISENDGEQSFAAANLSSPPHTPMFYPHQQFLPPQIIPGGMMMENTPPQSAPASQQCFPSNVYAHSPQHMHQFQPPVMYQQPMMYMPQPQQSHQVMNVIEQEQLQMGAAPQFTVTTSGPAMEMPLQFAQNGLAIVDAQGQISLAMPSQLQFVQHNVSRSDSSQGGQTAFQVSSSPETMPQQITAQMPRSSIQPRSDFFVHEYTPPQGMKRTSVPRKGADSGPKNYTFANQTPEHFEKSSKKGDKSSNGNSPESGDSA